MRIGDIERQIVMERLFIIDTIAEEEEDDDGGKDEGCNDPDVEYRK